MKLSGNSVGLKEATAGVPANRASAAGLRLGQLVAACLLLEAGQAGEVADIEPTTFWKRLEAKGVYERLWETLQFFEDEDNHIIQAASIVGRYHGQYWSVDADQGNADGWENRRIYLGAEALFFRQLTLHTQIKISEDFDPFYDGFYQAFAEWTPHDQFSLAVGRVDYLFTGLERSTSSTRIVTFERGLLANQLLPGEVVGGVAAGEVDRLSYRAGAFSGSIDQEFSQFEAGLGAVAGLGLDLPLFYESGDLHLDYLYNDGDAGNNALAPYRHVVSLWHHGQSGPFGLGVDCTWGQGLAGVPAVMGVTVLTTFEFARDVIRTGDALQAALRYQFASSDDDNGLQLPSRYEQAAVPLGSGDDYQAVYAGINYRIFGDRLKWMAGVEYASMRDAANDGGDYDGWTFLTGVRVYF